MQVYSYLEIKLFVMCHNIVLERITNYYKKGIEMYKNKKRILNITFIFPIHKYDWKLK